MRQHCLENSNSFLTTLKASMMNLTEQDYQLTLARLYECTKGHFSKTFSCSQLKWDSNNTSHQSTPSSQQAKHPYQQCSRAVWRCPRKASAELGIAKGIVLPDSHISSVHNELVTKKSKQAYTAIQSWAKENQARMSMKCRRASQKRWKCHSTIKGTISPYHRPGTSIPSRKAGACLNPFAQSQNHRYFGGGNGEQCNFPQ